MEAEKLLALMPDVLDGKKYVVLFSTYRRADGELRRLADLALGFHYEFKRRIVRYMPTDGYLRFIVAIDQNRNQLVGYELDGFVFDNYEVRNVSDPQQWHDELTIRCARSGGGRIL